MTDHGPTAFFWVRHFSKHGNKCLITQKEYVLLSAYILFVSCVSNNDSAQVVMRIRTPKNESFIIVFIFRSFN